MSKLLLLFEVMDKEPSLFNIWLVFMSVGAIGFILCRIYPAFLAIALPVVLFVSWAWLTELHDSFVGPAILHEAGYGYVVQSYIAISIAVVLPFLGAITWWRREKVSKFS